MLHGAFSVAIELVPKGQIDGKHLFSKGPRAAWSRHPLQGFLRHEENQSCYHLPWTHCCSALIPIVSTYCRQFPLLDLEFAKALLSIVLCSTPRTSERTMTLSLSSFHEDQSAFPCRRLVWVKPLYCWCLKEAKGKYSDPESMLSYMWTWANYICSLWASFLLCEMRVVAKTGYMIYRAQCKIKLQGFLFKNWISRWRQQCIISNLQSHAKHRTLWDCLVCLAMRLALDVTSGLLLKPSRCVLHEILIKTGKCWTWRLKTFLNPVTSTCWHLLGSFGLF